MGLVWCSHTQLGHVLIRSICSHYNHTSSPSDTGLCLKSCEHCRVRAQCIFSLLRLFVTRPWPWCRCWRGTTGTPSQWSPLGLVVMLPLLRSTINILILLWWLRCVSWIIELLQFWFWSTSFCYRRSETCKFSLNHLSSLWRLLMFFTLQSLKIYRRFRGQRVGCSCCTALRRRDRSWWGRPGSWVSAPRSTCGSWPSQWSELMWRLHWTWYPGCWGFTLKLRR